MRNYRINPINKTTGPVFILLLLALGAIGYSYSTWAKNLFIQSTVTTGKVGLIITSDKLLIPDTDDFNSTHPIHYYVTSDNLTLVADCENVTGTEWTVVMGLIVKNNGTIPVYLTQIAINFNTSASNFQVTTYYYNFDSSKWDGITFNDIPLPGNVSPPIQLDPNDRAITWTIIQLNAATADTQITATLEFHTFP
jgi:hypothetical protein